jgi:hypothetical protein
MRAERRRVVWLILAVAINATAATVSQGQTNSWISSTDGFWDEARFWSLAEPPSIAQSAILITNAASVTVTIDSLTANSFTSTLPISNLTLSAQRGVSSTPSSLTIPAPSRFTFLTISPSALLPTFPLAQEEWN